MHRIQILVLRALLFFRKHFSFNFLCQQRYKSEGQDTIILAGAEYGSGSSRDWAAKGPMLLV